MPTISPNPILAEELNTHQLALLDPKRSLDERFALLKVLYSRLEINQKEFYTSRHRMGLERIKKDYQLKTDYWNSELTELKKQFKQLDSRIIAAEQKLSRGIPEDLQIMDKLIAEQELIVIDQEKLNQAESDLLAHVKALDIEYGRQEEKLNQQYSTAKNTPFVPTAPSPEKIIAMKQKTELLVRISSILAILVLPLLLDYLTKGSSFLSYKQQHWIVRDHIIFLLSLVLVEVSIGKNIRQFITNLFISPFLKKAFNEIEEEVRKFQLGDPAHKQQ